MRLAILLIMCVIHSHSFSQGQLKKYKKSSNSQQQKKEDEKEAIKYRTHYFLAIKAKSLENFDEALKQFEKCIRINNKQPQPFYESALINISKGKSGIAEEQIKKAILLEQKNKWYILLYAEILFNNQDFKNAAKQYKKLLTIEPKNQDFYYALAETYIYDGAFSKAILTYDNLEKKIGVEKSISLQKYKLYMQIQKKKNAIKEILKLNDKYPNDIETLEILSELYLLNNEKNKAFEIFKKIGLLEPNNGRIHLTLADYYRDNGDDNNSFEELKKAFNSSNLDIDVKVQILASYFQLLSLKDEMLTQAYDLAKILIKTHSNETKSHAVYADLLYYDNKFEAAKEQYLIVLDRDKTKIQIWTQILFIQANLNEFEEMLKTSEEALTYFSTEPIIYYFNGIANKRMGHKKEAIEVLEMGVEFIFENQVLLVEFYSSLADLYHDLDENTKSDSLYEKVLSIDPDNIVVLNNYAYYLSLRKVNLEKAKKMSLKCNFLEKKNSTYEDTYAWVLYQLADYEKAKEWIEKALNNGGSNSAVIVEHYGDILYQIGEVKNAVIEWEKAKKIGGGSNLLNKKIENRKLYE